MPTRKTHGDVAVAIRMHSLPKQFKRTGVGQLCRGETGMLPSILQGNLDLKELEEMLPGFKILKQDAPPPPWASHFQRPCDGLANGLHASEQQAMDPSGRPSAPQALENAATTSLVPWVPSAGFKGKSKSLDSMAELLLGKSKSAGPDSEASSLAAIAKQPAAKQPCLKRPAAAALVSTGPKAAKVAIKLVSSASKAAKVESASTAPKAAKVEIKCPGIATKAKPPIEARHWRIYTDVRQGGWRCKRSGDKHDKMCSWKVDPRAAWEKVLGIVSSK
jgi:hypothetical protein